MTSKKDIVQYLNNNYQLEQLDENLFKLEVSWTDGRSQIVFVMIGDALVNISSPVGSLSDVNLPNLVSYVSENSLWGIRMAGEYICISDTGFTESMDAVELDVPIRLIAEAADEIEKIISNGNDIL